MHIWRLLMTPSTVYSNGIPLTKDRIFTVGEDQVETIVQQANGDFLISLTDEEDEDELGNPITIARQIQLPLPQVRIIHWSDEGE